MPRTRQKPVTPEAILKALTHPIRAEILRQMLTRPDREVSPTEMTAHASASLPTVAYHMRYLSDRGVVRRTRTRPVRGAVEHFYAFTSDEWRETARDMLKAVESLEHATR